MLKCDDCKKEKPDVEETICPYVYELYAEEEPCTICKDCYYNRCDEI